ncbi:MAG: M23 family metallopeptidase [Planctomycetota bacterium]|jgi:murein DD-endopeptidase MepM/ murein hydrolase activator NlpD
MRSGKAGICLVLLAALAAGCISAPASWSDAVAGIEDDGRYFLPYRGGTSRACVQTGPGPFSHEGSQAYAVDFAMPLGTPVHASRGGRVVGVKEDSDRGGMSEAYAEFGNYVHVLHGDGTRATYLHLQKDGALVAEGDVVSRGQVVGLSGCTGWSAMPHVHFQVDARDPTTGAWRSIPFQFADVAPDGRPAFLWHYVSGNVASPSADER